LQWGNAKGEPYTGNPYVRFDEGTEVVRPPPTLLVGAEKIDLDKNIEEGCKERERIFGK